MTQECQCDHEHEPDAIWCSLCESPVDLKAYGQALHDASIFPHGRADGFARKRDGSLITWADVDETRAACPFCSGIY